MKLEDGPAQRRRRAATPRPGAGASLSKLLRHTRIGRFDDPRLAAFKATPDGAGLNQVRDLAQEVGLNLRMAHRSPGPS